MKVGKRIMIMLIVATFTGCAANKAFVEGKQLIAEGKLDTVVGQP